MHMETITHTSPAGLHAQLDSLWQETFGFSLATWREQGFWSADYACLALVENEHLVASAGVYRMQLRVNGAARTALQLGGVTVCKDRRGTGLGRVLMQGVLDACPGEPLLLFAHRGVLDFYPLFGFRRVPDAVPALNWRIDNPPALPGTERISPDHPALAQALPRRACFSARLDVTNADPLRRFYLLQGYGSCLYHIPALDCLVIAEQEGETLTLLDVAAARPLSLPALAACLPFAGVRRVRFGFTPDWLVDRTDFADPDPDANLFVRGDLDLPAGSSLPWLART
ncbi:MAG: GNAT family N-acetyltransferase [Anaerolineae bacterium]|nr:GNAT family N-acetyltransferase [Anaerolineae bacterium]